MPWAGDCCPRGSDPMLSRENEQPGAGAAGSFYTWPGEREDVGAASQNICLFSSVCHLKIYQLCLILKQFDYG